MASKQVTNQSLQRDLDRWLIGLTALLSVVAGTAAGLLAFWEAHEAQDDMLRQFSSLLPTEIHGGPAWQTPHQVDDDSQVVVQRLGDSSARNIVSEPLPADGFATIQHDGDAWRVLVVTRGDSSTTATRYAIAQQTETRNEIALASGVGAAAPIALLATILLIVFRWIIWSKMRPVKQLASTINKRSVEDLRPLPIDGAPSEIQPFVAAINRLLARTNASIQQQRRFIADASHELRTPVTALSLISENLASEDSQHDRQQQLRMLSKGCTRLSTLTEQLLDLARLQNAASSEFVTIDAKALTKDVVAGLFPLAEAKNIDLGVVAHTDAVLADQQGGLRQLIENVLSNAILYTPHGGTIDVCLTRDADRVVLTVADTGPGIAEHELAKVLEPFYRATTNAQSGNGLGLAICHEIAGRLNGQITLSNRASGGLKVTYTQRAIV